MAQKKIDIKFNLDSKEVKIAGEETMKLSQQVRLLKAELASGKYSQEEFEILATKLGDVQDQMAQTKTRSGDLLTSLQLIPGPIGEIASKFNGAVSLLKQFSGFSLKDLKFQLKESLNDVKDIGKALAQNTGLASLFGKSVQATTEGFDAVSNGVKTATTSVKGFSKALVATGIGAIVVAVGLLVAYWDDIVGLVSGVSSEQKELNALTQENLALEQKKLSDLDGQTNQLKLQGKSEKEILQLKIQQTNQTITASELALKSAEDTKKAQLDASKRNQAILSGILQFLSLPITAILATIDAVSLGLKELGIIDEALTLREDSFDYLASFVFDPEEVAKEGEEAVNVQKDTLNKLKEQQAGYQLAVKDIDKAANEKKTANTKEQNDKKLEAQKILDDAELQLKSKQVQELEAVEADYQAKLKKLQEAGIVDDGNLLKLRDQKKKEINDKYAADELKRQQDLQNQLSKIEASRTETLTDDAQVEIDIVKQKYKALIDEATKNGKDITDLKKLEVAEIEKIEKDASLKEIERIADQALEIRQKKLSLLQIEGEALIAGTKSYAENRAEILRLAEESTLIELKKQLDTGKITREEYEKAITSTEAKYTQQRKDLKQQELAALGTTISATIDAVAGLGNAIASSYDEEAKTSKVAFEKRKKLQVATSLMSAASGLVQILTQPSTLPSPFDVIVKTANAAALAIATGVNISKIKAVKFDSGGGGETSGAGPSSPPPIQVSARRNQGGFVYGDGGSITDSIPAMLSDGEFVMNAKSASMFSPMLTAMNSMGNLPNTSIPQSLGNQSLVDVVNQSMNSRPIKTYVTAQDMSNQQQFDRTIKSRSLI